jgi:hypothetical protein
VQKRGDYIPTDISTSTSSSHCDVNIYIEYYITEYRKDRLQNDRYRVTKVQKLMMIFKLEPGMKREPNPHKKVHKRSLLLLRLP